MSIPRGPYESMQDAGDALRKVARVDGRGIMFCRTRTSGKRAVVMCNGVASLALRGESDIDHGVDCAYTAVIECWHGKHAKAPGTYWITRYTPHTFELCKSKPHYSVSEVAADSHVSAIINAGGAKTTAKAVIAAAREQLGVELSSKQASRVKMSALSEQKTKYRETFQRLPSYARVFLDRNEGSVFDVGGAVGFRLAPSHPSRRSPNGGEIVSSYVCNRCVYVQGPHYRGYAIQTAAVIDGVERRNA